MGFRPSPGRGTNWNELERIGTNWNELELVPSVGVLAKHVYNLPALFPFSKAEVGPARNRYTLAIAEVDLQGVKISQRHLVAIQFNEYVVEVITPLSADRAYCGADRIPSFLVGESPKPLAGFQNSLRGIFWSRHGNT